MRYPTDGKVFVESLFLILLELLTPDLGRLLGIFSGFHAVVVRGTSGGFVGNPGRHRFSYVVD
jgi:hypothetical protein